MAESAAHIGYVSMISEYVKNMLPSEEHIHLLVDSPYSHDTPPLLIDKFRPDLYYYHNHCLIIGEAKTDDDFDRPHSHEQYLSYIKECSQFDGEAFIIVSGSWRISPAFANLLKNIKRRNANNTKIIVLNEMGLFKEFE